MVGVAVSFSVMTVVFKEVYYFKFLLCLYSYFSLPSNCFHAVSMKNCVAFLRTVTPYVFFYLLFWFVFAVAGSVR